MTHKDTNLINEIFPVFDQAERAFVAILILRQLEGGASSPKVKFTQRLPYRHFTLGSLIQLLQVD